MSKCFLQRATPQYAQLENFIVKPAWVMCNYQCYDNIFENKRVGVWNREIKQMDHGYAYCGVALCKKHFDIFYTTTTMIEGA